MRVIIPTLSEQNTDENEEALKAAVIEAYDNLFEDLNTQYRSFFASLTPALEVNNIVTFYRGIRAILDDGSQQRPNPVFFRLPLDEPQFTINMDTRIITVPKVFQDNGLGVKGDANAEVVFFEVDRYYDGVDLAAMTPGTTTNQDPSTYNCVVQWQNTGSNEKGNSQVILADVIDDKLVFGWMITHKITSKPGTIYFAVRWTQLEDGVITYSISTQQATCNVKSTLDLDYGEVEDVSDIIYTRPFYSGIINSMSGSSPNVTTNLVTSIENLRAIDGSTAEGAELLEQYPIATYPNGILQLSVDANSPDGMPIVYQWYNGALELPLINNATQKTYIATAPGQYFVKIGNDGTSKNTGIRYVTSPTVTVPAPDQIKFEQTRWFGAGTYSDGADDHAPSVLVKNVEGNDPNGALVYTWKKANMLNAQNQVIPLASLEDADFAVINGANEASYKPAVDTEAYYKCEVVNKLNNTDSNIIKTAEPAVIRAVPVAPQSVTIEFDEANQALKIAAIDWGTAPARFHPDEIRYEWGSLKDNTYTSGVGYGDRYRTFSVAGLTLDNGNTWNSDFYCKVQHVVFRNNNGGQEKASEQTTSAWLRLYVKVDANNQVIVQNHA